MSRGWTVRHFFNHPISSLYILCLLIECWLKQKLSWAELGNVRGCCWRLLAAVWWSLPDGQTHSGSSSTPALPEDEETKTDPCRIPSPQTHFGLSNEVDQSKQNHIQLLLLWYASQNKHKQEWMKSLHKMGLQILFPIIILLSVIQIQHYLYLYNRDCICACNIILLQWVKTRENQRRQNKEKRCGETNCTDMWRWYMNMNDSETDTRTTQLNMMFLSWGKCFLFLTLSQKVEQWACWDSLLSLINIWSGAETDRDNGPYCPEPSTAYIRATEEEGRAETVFGSCATRRKGL